MKVGKWAFMFFEASRQVLSDQYIPLGTNTVIENNRQGMQRSHKASLFEYANPFETNE